MHCQFILKQNIAPDASRGFGIIISLLFAQANTVSI